MKRRDFLKFIGAGGAGAGLGFLFGKLTKAPGAKLIPRLIPPEDVVPGVGTWYATACKQCNAGCGILVKAMDGHARKIEGNPLHPVNKGGLCKRGQAGLQGLYNPDRIKGPLKRTGERGSANFSEISWDEAVSMLSKNLSGLQTSGRQSRVYLLTSKVNGLSGALISNFMSSLGSPNHIRYELFQPRNLSFANQVSMGNALAPHYDIENTRYLLSFGADFTSTWLSPAGYGHAYGNMRQGGRVRGKLVQVEPRLSATGANADEWVPARPGTEGLLALSIAYAICANGYTMTQKEFNRTAAWKSVLSPYRPEEVAKTIDVGADRIYAIAKEFARTRPSLALPGGTIGRYDDGHGAVVAVNVLNHVAGNIGEKGGLLLKPDAEKTADYRANIARLNEAALGGKIETLIVYNANPVFTTPKAMRFEENLKKIPFIASLSSFMDETTANADLVLPAHHFLEDWGDDVASTDNGRVRATLMQPAVTPVFDTRGLGDIFITVGRAIGGRTAAKTPTGAFADYLKESWKERYNKNRAGFAGSSNFDDFWNRLLQNGGYFPPDPPRYAAASISASAVKAHLPKAQADFDGDATQYPFYLEVYPHSGYLDGSLANSPWLQEIPDPVSSVVWGSWAEINPATAKNLGINEGDMISVESPSGAVRVPAYIYPGIRPDTVAIPIGQGHTHYGRYAKGRGANPLEILPFKENQKSGQIALNSTRVRLSKAGPGDMVKMEGSTKELGRDIVKVISPEEFEKTRSGAVAPGKESPGHGHS